ncbi:polymorphic toxin-type HINT domain-containing protein [Rhizohabitans arisaemae]|uniref:polymorphic toxin-type HINT domain-containing protein n=1 Tax=Rhizohabitans arisaemae TaxID=2720610 RepID=UPI0024B0CF47|nr:polymorphic toxin-type HINT domain-containing protein [Rhizohabitans arisaemae]
MAKTRRGLVLLSAVATAVTVMTAELVVPDLIPVASAAAPPGPVEKSVAGREVPAVKPYPALERQVKPEKRTEPVWPKAGTAEVDLSEGAKGTKHKAGDLPVEVAKTGADSPSRVRVETLDQETVRRLGGAGLGVRLTRADGTQAGKSAAGQVTVTMSYAGFRDAHGGNYPRRLGVVRVNSCATAPEPPTGCDRSAHWVPAANNVEAGLLVATVEASEANAYLVASAVAAPEGSPMGGTFGATDLKPAGQWQAGGSGGSFSYSYPIPQAASMVGEGPDLALTYDSGAVDGMTKNTNNQSGWVGLGWDLSSGFIERTYKRCAADHGSSPANSYQSGWADMCWESPDTHDGEAGSNDRTTSELTLSLAGRSMQIVKDRSSGTYRTLPDQGWKIQELTGGADGLSYWQVTTQDGTVWRLGYTRDAQWRLPYAGNEPGEPCHNNWSGSGTTPTLCTGVWRWNVDRMVDTRQNLTEFAYTKQQNYYCSSYNRDTCFFASTVKEYDRGGHLASVQWGQNLRVTGSRHTSRIMFNAADMDPALVPSDLQCPRPQGTFAQCANHSVSFFASRRLDSAVTSSFDAVAGTWSDLARLQLRYVTLGSQMWLDTVQYVGLAGGQITTPPVDFDAVNLNSSYWWNEAGNECAVWGNCEGWDDFPRIGAIANGFGGRIEVSYTQPNPCMRVDRRYNWTGHSKPSARDCWTDGYYDSSLGLSPSGNVYQKWTVSRVTEKDLVTASPDKVTEYRYMNAPAWTYPITYVAGTENPPLLGGYRVEDASQWRGYQRVYTIRGSGPDPEGYTVSSSTWFRGVDGAQVTDFEGGAWTDRPWLAGQVLEERTWRKTPPAALVSKDAQALAGPTVHQAVAALGSAQTDRARPGNALMAKVTQRPDRVSAVMAARGQGTRVEITGERSGKTRHYANPDGTIVAEGPGGRAGVLTVPKAGPKAAVTSAADVQDGYTELGSTRHEYWTQTTGEGPGRLDPILVKPSRERGREVIADGTFRQRETRTAYDSYGLPVRVNGYGLASTADDNTCTVTTYARNTATWLIDFPAMIEEHAGDDCATGAVTARKVTLYDGGTNPAANVPTVGDVTERRVWANATQTLVTKAGFDAYGRPVSSTDALGKITTIAYSPAVNWPSDGVKVTNPRGDAEITWTSRLHGQTTGFRDANGKETNIDQDALGRTTTLWGPGEPRSGGTPTATFAYHYPFDGNLGQPTGPVKTTVSQLQSGSGSSASYLTFHTYKDGMGRVRESQTASPSGGRVVSVTAYDGRGLTVAQAARAHNGAAPGSGLLNPVLTSLPTWTKTVFDHAERPNARIDYAGATELRRTTSTYSGADRYAAFPPTGLSTEYVLDQEDRPLKVTEWAYFGHSYETAYTYAYDPRGNLTKVTDAKGNVKTFTYDWLGRRVGSTDPDSGESAVAYDGGGRVAWTRDANGQKVSFQYDDLNRPVAQWAGEPGTGTKLAEWTYDTVAKGQLTSATRFSGGQPYTDIVTGYDPSYRPTGSKVVIPASEGPLAGEYEFGTAYDKTGRITSQTMPAAGGLAAETLAYGFTAQGYASTLTSNFGGSATYVKGTDYSPTGRLLSRSYGSAGQIKRTLTWDEGWNRVTNLTTQTRMNTTAPVTVQNDAYFYDVGDNIRRIADRALATPQNQCYDYDNRNRLIYAYTNTQADCSAGWYHGADSGGPDPYWEGYTYDAVGNITTKQTWADGLMTYNYPPGGAATVRPNAVTSVQHPGSRLDTYTYDAAGQLASRTVDGKNATFTWDALGKVTGAVVNGQRTDNVYDTEGERLIRREGGTTTLYLGSMELELTGGAVRAKRYYTTAAGSMIAVRTPSSLTWLLSDGQGSTQFAVDDATQAVSRQRYLPFGDRRGGRDDIAVTDLGFLGKTEDNGTELSLLGARFYDPALARFISPDPLLDLRTPQLTNPYSYAENNPIRSSDPSGLAPDNCNRDSPTYRECKKAEDHRMCVKHFGKQACNQKMVEEMRQRVNAELQRLFEALKGIAKIAADELGITAAVDCFSKGDLGACGETALNVLSSLAGGLLGKLVSKYGLPWKWRELAKLGEKLFGLGKDAVNSFKSWRNAADELKRLEDELRAAARSCKSSFVVGTHVVMADGSRKPIEQVQVGDEVRATDPETGETVAKPVVAVMTSKEHKNLVQITVDVDGDRGDETGVVIATDEHPFWVPALGGWRPAAELEPGHVLRTGSGTQVRVAAVAEWGAVQRVHNFTVGDLHTYYVAAGDTDVLVHNDGPCYKMASAIHDDPYLVKAAQQAGKSNQKGLDHLFDQLSKGNMNPGSGTEFLKGTDVMYARTKDGARLYFRKVGNTIVVVAKSNKKNQQKVIDRLREIYG